MQAVGIIPARWGSRRFPGKVAAPISGVAMVERVWRAVRRSDRLRDVLVATDDPRIATLCRDFGAEAVMTSPDHATGTDRVAEAASGLADDVIVNVQADEPLIEPFVIDAALDALEKDPEAPMATVVHPAESESITDPNRVTVRIDHRERALDFARGDAVIEVGEATGWQHVGLYAYRRAFLLEFVTLPRGRAERVHELEQLRALEHGHPIAVGRIDGWQSAPVDVPADVIRVERRLRDEAARRMAD
jgi:3-deoxy-manno-octulosonate cytidylyltransferase (CMP-KDO synthetase)